MSSNADRPTDAGTIPRPRRRYPADHWARRPATEENLAAYLKGANAYNLTKVRIFERLLEPDLTGQRVLDYGGGAGFMAVRCAERGAEVTLVDAEASALDTAMLLARRHGVAARLRVVCSEDLPAALRERPFDVVIVKDVVEHIPDDFSLLSGLSECQQPGGRLLLSTQNTWSLNYLLEGTYRRRWRGEQDWLGWDPTHLRFYTPPSLERLLRGAGYAVQCWNGLYIIPYNILSWLTLGFYRRDFDALHRLDLWMGHLPPFNRLGWNVIVRALRSGNEPRDEVPHGAPARDCGGHATGGAENNPAQPLR